MPKANLLKIGGSDSVERKDYNTMMENKGHLEKYTDSPIRMQPPTSNQEGANHPNPKSILKEKNHELDIQRQFWLKALDEAKLTGQQKLVKKVQEHLDEVDREQRLLNHQLPKSEL